MRLVSGPVPCCPVYETLLIYAIDKHASVEERYPRRNQNPLYKFQIEDVIYRTRQTKNLKKINPLKLAELYIIEKFNNRHQT